MDRAQQQFGVPIELVVKKIFPAMPEMIQEFVRAAPFAVLSMADGKGKGDASPKGLADEIVGKAETGND